MITLKKTHWKKYEKTDKRRSSGSETSKQTVEIVHSILGNLAQTKTIKVMYVDEYKPWLDIL